VTGDVSGAALPIVRASLPRSSIGVLLGKGFQLGSGFLFWMLAARVASVSDIGLAAATTSAVMFSTQVGVLGTSSAVIIHIGRGTDPRTVLDAAFTLVGLAGAVTAAIYLVASSGVATAGLSGMRAMFYVLLVVGSTALGTAMICLDQASIALGRAGGSVLRNSVGGIAAGTAVVGCLSVVRRTGVEVGTLPVFACWTLSTVAAASVGVIQLRRWIHYRFRPALPRSSAQMMLGLGVPNQLLTLTERAPQLLLPVLLVHSISAEAAAFWYPAWMMAWIVYTAPVSVGLVQFAHGVQDPDTLRRTTWSGLRWSLLLGGGLALVLVVAAPQLLALMGPDYAAASTPAVRVLSVGLVPYAVLQAYNALCRVRHRLTEAIAVGVLVGAVACGSGVLVAHGGSVAIATAWVASLGCGAVWALIRLPGLVATAGSSTVERTAERRTEERIGDQP
jgi:O-antigen/teichoic acid export membrane protein